MDPGPLLERPKAHRTIGGVPLRELEWLARAGTVRTLEPHEVRVPSSAPVTDFDVVLEGHLSVRVDRGAGPRIVMEWRGGDVTGVLPYSRLKRTPGTVVAEERRTILAVDGAELPRMIHECPELTTQSGVGRRAPPRPTSLRRRAEDAYAWPVASTRAGR